MDIARKKWAIHFSKFFEVTMMSGESAHSLFHTEAGIYNPFTSECCPCYTFVLQTLLLLTSIYEFQFTT